jgi:hypothetical protein
MKPGLLCLAVINWSPARRVTIPDNGFHNDKEEQ